VRIRLILLKAIFNKINSLSGSPIQMDSYGKMVNIISNGLNAFENKTRFLFYLLLSPISIGIIDI
jgi:hypothetical protein